MFRLVVSLATCVVLVYGVVSAEDDVAIDKKLSAAKEKFESATENARAQLLSDLVKKEIAIQKAGDLKGLEKLQAEIKAFEDRGELPTLVSTKRYESMMRTAAEKLEGDFVIAVKQYTKEGKLAQAKAIQSELDELKARDAFGTATDSFKPKSIWVGENGRLVMTVVERKGQSFRATLEIGNKIARDITGTIKGRKVSWLGKDVRVIRGSAGGDNDGTFGSDKAGDKIDFVWKSGDGTSGTYTLRPAKGS